MLGAIIGDVVGSVYEFNNVRTKDFKLITNRSTYTDDTVLTVAVMDVLLNGNINNNDEIIKTVKYYCNKYPTGYGGRFARWLNSDSDKPYYSCGNGAAMRISPVGMLARDEEQVKDWAKKVTQITHNHPEGLLGAEVVAMCVYYARKGKDKQFIKNYVSQYYDINFDYETLRKTYSFDATCQGSVPQAIYCFLISNDFEDCLRTTISVGGDCDTTSAISCAIAGAFYGIPSDISNKVYEILPNGMKRVIDKFNDILDK